MADSDPKKFKAQKIYISNVLHEDLYPFLQKNPKTRSVHKIEENQHIFFYLEGARHASCVISPKGKVIISYVKDWEHNAILEIVKDAMQKLGCDPDDPENLKFIRYHVPYDVLKNPDEHLKHIYQEAIPGLKKQLEKAETKEFGVSGTPYLILGVTPIFEKDNYGRVVVKPKPEDADFLHNMQIIASFDEEIRKELDELFKERFESVGLPLDLDENGNGTDHKEDEDSKVNKQEQKELIRFYFDMDEEEWKRKWESLKRRMKNKWGKF